MSIVDSSVYKDSISTFERKLCLLFLQMDGLNRIQPAVA